VRLLLIAPPGAGRRAQGRALAERLGLSHVSSGDLLRAKAAEDSPAGHLVAACIALGDLVPDRLVFDALTPAVITAAVRGGFVLEGFPRTVAQSAAATALGNRLGLTLDAAVYLYQGSAEMDHRLEVFDRYTRPLVAHYRDRGILVAVDADQAPAAVTAEILGRLRDLSLLGGAT
jgi:adenylate kinase